LIKSEQYQELKAKRTSDVPILKKRKHFLYGRGSYFIDTVVNAGGHSVLYADYTRDFANQDKLPEGIEIEKEVTNVAEYSSVNLKTKWKDGKEEFK